MLSHASMILCTEIIIVGPKIGAKLFQSNDITEA